MLTASTPIEVARQGAGKRVGLGADCPTLICSHDVCPIILFGLATSALASATFELPVNAAASFSVGMHLGNDRTKPLRLARDALSRVRRCMSRRFFFAAAANALLRYRS
jgi:hypothetical protein